MKRLAILLIAGMVWTQVTPTDKNGCAGYTPSGYDKPNLSPHSTTVNLPSRTPAKRYIPSSPERTQRVMENRGHVLGDNLGHGQFNDYNRGGNSWNQE